MAEKDARTYIRVHDGMPDHPKVDGLSDAAFRLLVTMWCWSSRHLTDGRVPGPTWLKRGTAKARGELVATGLADLTEDGMVQMHDYTDHQRTAEEVQALLDAKAKGGELGNHIRWHQQRGIIDPACDHCTDRTSDRTTDRKTIGPPVANASQNVAIGIDIVKGKKSEVADAPSGDDSDDVPPIEPRDDVERICRHLVDRMVANGCAKPAITNRWREAARLLLDRDKRTEAQVIAAIDWAQNHEFWRANIKSIPKLRAQYDTLRLQASARGGKSNVHPVDFGAPPKDPKDRPAYAVDDVRGRWTT